MFKPRSGRIVQYFRLIEPPNICSTSRDVRSDNLLALTLKVTFFIRDFTKGAAFDDFGGFGVRCGARRDP